MKILVDASLPNLSQWFPEPFELTPFHHLEQVKAMLPGHHALVCRSTLHVDESLLGNVALQCVATASSGTDHINKAHLADRKIRILDAKGSNATAVADYVTATVAWLEQNQRLHGQSVGIVGMGHVGSKVYARLKSLGYEVIGFDPYLAQKAPQDYEAFEALFDCDLICIHANLHRDSFYPSENLFNREVLRSLKSGIAIINASRGGIVNESELLYLPSIVYCTDVYLNEPHINSRIVDFSTLCTPHIAGHTVEGKLNAMALLSQQLHEHFNLPLSSLLSRGVNQSPALSLGHWPIDVLEIYNPHQETVLLKQASDITHAFLALRRAHSRYDLK